MWARRAQAIEIKTAEQFASMREAGLVVAHTLAAVAAAVRPGVSTAELDALAEREIRAAGATPSFLGYHGYPATICASVNDQIVHGICRGNHRSARRSRAARDNRRTPCRSCAVRRWRN